MQFDNVSSYYDDIKCRLIESMKSNRLNPTSGSKIKTQYVFHEVDDTDCMVFNLNPEIKLFDKDDLKIAWAAWMLMDHTDRLEVISFFCQYYQEELYNKSPMERTLLFCSLFLERFIPLLNFK